MERSEVNQRGRRNETTAARWKLLSELEENANDIPATAQRCDEGATLGHREKIETTLKALRRRTSELAARISRYRLSQGSSFLATLGWGSESIRNMHLSEGAARASLIQQNALPVGDPVIHADLAEVIKIEAVCAGGFRVEALRDVNRRDGGKAFLNRSGK